MHFSIGIFKIHYQPIRSIPHIIWISKIHVLLAQFRIANFVIHLILAANVRTAMNGKLMFQLLMDRQDIVQQLGQHLHVLKGVQLVHQLKKEHPFKHNVQIVWLDIIWEQIIYAKHAHHLHLFTDILNVQHVQIHRLVLNVQLDSILI